MKIRIQDNSVRYRITIKELENLNKTKSIESKTEIFNPITKECDGSFHYSVYSRQDADDSYCEITPNAINLILSDTDVTELNDPNKEGVYIQKETPLPDGTVHKFMVFIEKDRPATKCDKRDEWIYEKDLLHNDKTVKIGLKQDENIMIQANDLVCDVFERHGMCKDRNNSPTPVPISHFANRHCAGRIEDFWMN